MSWSCFQVSPRLHGFLDKMLVRDPAQRATAAELLHLVVHRAAPIDFSSAPRVEFDASPWGGGALLKVQDKVVSWFAVGWTSADARRLGAKIGDPAGQTSWELLTLFLVLLVYGADHRPTGLAILGNNTASLQAALSLKIKGKASIIAKEIAWRKARLGWRYSCGHLPSELNRDADALSRISAPGAGALPAAVLDAQRVEVPLIEGLWSFL